VSLVDAKVEESKAHEFNISTKEGDIMTLAMPLPLRKIDYNADAAHKRAATAGGGNLATNKNLQKEEEDEE
jgi:hypothetical protein